MKSLALALRGWQGRGREIDIPFRRFADLVDFRTGQVAVLAGAPGGGKSTVAANWAWRTQQPTLYLAQDDPSSVLGAMVAIATNRRLEEVHFDDVEYWASCLEDMGKRDELVIETGAQTVQGLEARLEALTEWLMEPPPLVFVDNLFDMKSEGSSYMEVTFYADILPAVKQLAIAHDVGIVLLHHVTRSGEKGKKHGLGTEPLTMTDLLFGGEKEAAHVWGVYHSQDKRQMYLQILKQRNGKAEPGGGLRVPFSWQAGQGILHSL